MTAFAPAWLRALVALAWCLSSAVLVVAWAPSRPHRGSPSRLGLRPLTVDEIPESIPPSVLDSWVFSLLERKDLAYASQFALDSFYSPRVVFNMQGASSFELWILNGLKVWHEKIDRSDTYNGNYLGFRSRSGDRLSNPNLEPSSDSFILVASPRSNSTQIAGLVEICLEVADGKLAPPIQWPWKPKLTGSECPYLCNLCVDTTVRRQGLGSILVDVAEKLVVKHWKKRTMYLHVEKKNVAAHKLYSKLDYALASESAESVPYGLVITSYPDIDYFSKILCTEP